MAKKIMISFLCLLAVFSAGKMKALANENENSIDREEYARIADAFGSYYTVDGETNFPEYFAGMYFLNDGSLIFYLTDTEPETIDFICSICGCETIKYKKVTYSFNQLYQQMQQNRQYWDEWGLVRETLDIPENKINVYFDDNNIAAKRNREVLPLSVSTDLYDMCNFIPYVSDNEVISDTKMEDDSTERILDEMEEVQETELQEPESKAARASRILIGAPGEVTRKYTEDAKGTIGFYVTYGSGKRGLITHGHQMGIGDEYCYLHDTNDIIGKVVNVYGDVGSSADASLVELANSSLTLSNQIYGTTSVVKRYITIANALAIGKRSGYFKGSTSGVTAITIDVLLDKNNFRIAWENNLAQQGDSGGPIYTRVGTDATLYGLVSQTTQTKPISYGVYVQSILDVSRDVVGVPLTFYKE